MRSNHLMVAAIYFVSILVCSIFLNYIRHSFSLIWNKIAFIASLLLVTVVSNWLFGDRFLPWLLLLFLFVSAFTFYVYGAVTVALVAIAVFELFHGISRVYSLAYPLFYIVFAVILGFFFRWMRQVKVHHQEWINRLLKQSKDLHILQEISVALQSTLELDRVIHIILTSITAGYGLGFNRALLFAASDTRDSVSGLFGIGPMSVEDGYQVWKDVVSTKMTLSDFIALKDKARIQDHQLNAILQTMTFSLTDTNSIFYKSLQQGSPVVIKTVNHQDTAQRRLQEAFHMTEFAVVPLLNRSKAVGILVIDNLVNQRTITDESLESIMPIASQAALAIENARAFNEIEWMAQTDSLTGLFNQRHFQATLHEWLNRAKIDAQEIHMIMADIDYFKIYNDSNGHDCGNVALQNVARIMKDVIGERGIVCRFGGEEFIVLMAGTTKLTCLDHAEKIRAAIESWSFAHEESQPGGQLTISLGVASFPADANQSDQLFHCADTALYRAKSSGRNCIALFQGEEGHE